MPDDAASATADLFVGLDLGTSSLKGVAVSAGGVLVAHGHAPDRTQRPGAGRAEQAPTHWLRALRSVARQLSAAAAPDRWRAVGLSGMIPTLVTTGADGRPTGPAITWEDSRAEAEGAGLRSAIGADQLYRLTGQWVDGRYLLPMFLWLRQHDPHRAAAAAHVLSAKDYLYWSLTGEYATDPSTASGFGCYGLAAGDWLAGVSEAARVGACGSADTARVRGGATAGRPALPAVLPSTTMRPLARAVAARLGLPPGLPVCLGAADSVLGMLALGVTGPGDVAYVTGSSSVIVGLSRELALDAGHRYLVTPLACADGWGLEMDLLTTGSAVNWLARLVRLSRRGEAAVMELAATADDDAGGARFVPSLGLGEQGALWDPELRGTLLGLSLAHGPAEIARALVEGILFESRRCLDVLAQNGLPPAPIRLAGAGGSSPFFRQCLADLSGREVLYAVDDERPFSALGAALVAAEATGAAPQDPGAWAGPMHRTAPNPARRAHWEARWREYRELVAGLQQLYRAK